MADWRAIYDRAEDNHLKMLQKFREAREEVRQKTEGSLCFNSKTHQYGLKSGSEWVVEGFRCGDLLEIWKEGEWIPTRIEYNGGWSLFGYPGHALSGMKARV